MGKYNEHDGNDFLLKVNLLGIKDNELLEEAESFVFSLRALQLEQGSYKLEAFKLQDFKGLHFHLFQDIYPFAGQFRDVQLSKGTTRFCQYQFIDVYAKDLFRQLNNEPTWNNIEQVAKRLSYFKSELNMLYPFREGNGRTIRIFLQAFARSKGVIWDFTKLDKGAYLSAMIESVTNTNFLEKLFIETVEYDSNSRI